MLCQKGGSASRFVLLLETCSSKVICGRCHQAGSLGALRNQVCKSAICTVHIASGLHPAVVSGQGWPCWFCLAVSKALQKAVRCLVTHLLSFLLQLSMLFTEECDKVRDLMHVHSFSYDFHLRIVHQYLLGSHMTLRQGYHLTSFLEDFIAHHTDIPKFGRNHVFQGE